MRHLTTTLIALFVCAIGWSQNGSVSGKLTNESNEPAAFVALALMDADSSLAKAGITDDKGDFSFSEVPSGSYQLVTSSIEFAAYSSPFFEVAGGSNVQLDPIQLSGSVQELEEVQVTAVKPLIEVEPDRTIFNVESSPNATGSDGIELLRKSPGVVIDNNDNIILQGKTGVQIYIDDKPVRVGGDDLTAMLRNLQSDQIEAIEIITNPSARYDAAGNAGIINIRLKRDKNLGTKTTINGGYSVTNQAERYRAGINTEHRGSKFSVFGNLNYYDLAGWNFQQIYREQNGAFYDQNGQQTWAVEGVGYRVGGDVYLGAHTLGVVVNGNVNDRANTNDSRTFIGNQTVMLADSILQANNDRNTDSDNANVNLHYIWRGEGKSINVDLDYGYWQNAAIVAQPNLYLDPISEIQLPSSVTFSNTNDTKIDIYTAKADYETGLGKGKITLGAKISSVLTDNGFTQFNESTGEIESRSANFDYTEIVTAGYVSYFVALGKKVNLNAGLRMENTFSEGDLDSRVDSLDNVVDRRYTDLFPSGGLTYALSKKHKFGLNYSRRIDRPNYQDLNPFEFQLDELTFEKGNPFLNPQYTHNVQFTHTFNSMINTRLSYSVTDDFFARVIEIASDNPEERATILQQQNLATSKNIGANISVPLDIKKWWSIFTSLNFNRNIYESELSNDNLSLNLNTYNVFLQNNFLLPKGYKLEVSGWYNSPSIWGGTFLTSEIYSVNVGVQKQVLKGRGNIRVNVNDLFLTQRWTGESNYNNVVVDIRGGNDSRRYNIGFTYRIGNDQVRIRNRKTGLEAEAKRVGNDN